MTCGSGVENRPAMVALIAVDGETRPLPRSLFFSRYFSFFLYLSLIIIYYIKIKKQKGKGDCEWWVFPKWCGREVEMRW